MPTLLKGIDSFGDLFLIDCEELMTLEGLMGLQSIEHLYIEGCPKLVRATGSDFTIVIEMLEIDDPLLLASGVLLRSITSVQGLKIWNCRQLESIDGELEQWLLKNQTTLKRIWIHEASFLKSLPSCLKNLSSLESLEIDGASETLLERCRKDEGADWPTISHIPKIEITRK